MCWLFGNIYNSHLWYKWLHGFCVCCILRVMQNNSFRIMQAAFDLLVSVDLLSVRTFVKIVEIIDQVSSETANRLMS